MAQTQDHRNEPEASRIVDARRHFLGLVKKGGEILVYCRQCRGFFSVMFRSLMLRPPAAR